MIDALEDHIGTCNIGGSKVIHLRFVDDIDGLAREEQELVNLVSRLEKSASNGKETSAEKTMLMTNNINGINNKINVREQRNIVQLQVPGFSFHKRGIQS